MRTACIQINSGNKINENIARVESLVKDAVSAGAKFVLLPENVALMSENKKNLFENSFLEDEHPALSRLKEIAKELNIWILIGSLQIKIPEIGDKLYNRSYLIGNDGEIKSLYDKIHLYDVVLANGERYVESANFAGGSKVVVANTPFGNLGMTICYDVRFPHLFRTLAKKGADFISVPAAFTEFTGKAHWHVLLRARAIENGCYILAPAQTGTHPNKRETYGHAMIISPWGEILSDAGEEEGFAIADIDAEEVRRVRASLPSLSHDRDFSE